MAFLPTDISGLAGWWDANDAASVTGSTPVTQWNDKSGNARHLTHATAGPDFITGSQLMRFNGPASAGITGDTLDMPAMTARTVIVFVKAITPQTAANRYHAILGHGANTDSLYLDLPAGTPASYGIRPKGGLNKVSLNGGGWISQTVVDATVPAAFTLSGDIILAEYASGRTSLNWVAASGSTRNWRPNIDLAEMLIYDRVLTAEEKRQVEGYLAHKWARTDLLPSDHPYKTSAPGEAELAVYPGTHGHSATSPALAAGGTLAIMGGTHGHVAGSPALSPAGITLNDIAAHRIFQRVGAVADLALSGGYAGAAPAEVQARVMQGAAVVKDWTTIGGATIGGGGWSGTLAGVPQGGMYRLEVRGRSGGGAVLASAAGANSWGVGDIFGLIGSSSAERWFTIGAGYSPSALLKVYDGSWKAATATGAAAVTFGNQAIADAGVPVAILDFGVGGTKLSQWMLTSNAGYVAFRNALAAVGRIKAVIAVVGMNDARAGEITSQSAHEANWRTLIGHIRADAADPSLPVLIWGAQRCLQAGMIDQQFAWMRNAEHAVGADAQVTLAVTTVDLGLIADNLHLTEGAMVTAAARLARTAGALFYGTGLEWRRPEVASAAKVSETQSDVTIAHRGGNDLTPPTGITGFQISVNDFATTLSISAGVRQSANVIRLTHASTGGATAKLRYQYGAAPDVSGAVNDNVPLPLPLASTSQAVSVWSGTVLAPAMGVHAVTGQMPLLSGDLPPESLIPANANHAMGGQMPSLFSGFAQPPHRQVLRVGRETRRLAVNAN